MRELLSEIEIDAPIGDVWDVLTRFEDFPEWNPFIRAAEGEVKVNGKIRVTVQPPGRRPMTFSPRLLVVDPPRELRWRGRVGFQGVFDGEHGFRLESAGPRRTRVVQRERFTGILVPVMGKGLYADTQKGFDALLQSLKGRVEGRRSKGTPDGLSRRGAD